MEQREQSVRRRLVRGDEHRRQRGRHHRLEDGRQLECVRIGCRAHRRHQHRARTVGDLHREQHARRDDAAFETAWFGSSVPSGFTIGTYSGSGVGLSTGGDAVNLFDAAGRRVTGVVFGSSSTGFTFDNAAGIGRRTLPLPAISTLSVVQVNGAFLSATGLETGSPGRSFLNRPPVANAGADQPTVEATGPGGALVTLNGTGSSDPEGDSLTYSWTEGGSSVASGAAPSIALTLGSHTLTLTVDDGRASASDTVLIVVRDTTAPTISSVVPSLSELWPADNKAVPIGVAVTAADSVTAPPACAITSVWSNEAGQGQWQITGAFTLELLARRDGSGTGRMYTVGVECSDAAGNIAAASAVVLVPHDQRR